jgi:flagellar hook-associated protein 2
MDSINRIRFSGIASGLDTENIVKNLMNIEQMKVDRQIQKKTLLEWKRDEYRNINNRLRTLREQNVFNLKLQGTFLAKKVASSDESALSATASFNTLEGSYTVTVNKLAKAASFTATPADLGENGLVPVETEASFTINGGEGREDVTITVGHSDTLASVVAKINANSSKSGVRAMYDENLNKLFLTSTSTGEKGQLRAGRDRLFLRTAGRKKGCFLPGV